MSFKPFFRYRGKKNFSAYGFILSCFSAKEKVFTRDRLY
ncbi:hypothetical protein LL3_00880 [Bacillus amyloliquefaciens LL3]|nr:hypothetical protein LL3_00880 [Bacillus amyloliquefaciens LL3]